MKLTTSTTARAACAALLLAAAPVAAFAQDSEAADDAAPVAETAPDADAALADAEPAELLSFNAYGAAASIVMDDDGGYALADGAVSGAALLDGRVAINGATAGEITDVILSEYGYGQFITYEGGRYVTFFESDLTSSGGVTVSATREAGGAPRIAPAGATNTLTAWLAKKVHFEDGDAGHPIVDVVFTDAGMMDLAIVDASAAGGPARAVVPAVSLIDTETGGLRAIGRWSNPSQYPAVDGV